MKPIEQLELDNSYARLPAAFHSRQRPTPLRAARLVSFNPAVAKLLDLDPAQALRPEFTAYFSGQHPLPGGDPIAMLYAGHQFGHYVPQLGDGRAILLGEVRNSQGERWDLHLKGAGETPYSRSGDGRAVLRSTIREYLCGEAMHGLGIPSSRALCLFASDEEVYRESIETGAMLVRVAPSHLRFGSFEVFYYRNQFEQLRQLADYAISHHFPELSDRDDRYADLFAEVVARTARLVAQWQLVGFTHGVLNTDNMSLLGLTLDYGPYGFMDAYQPGFVCNHSDHSGRYAFDQQPYIGLWNLSCLGQALLPLLDPEPQQAAEKANDILSRYNRTFTRHYADGMRTKLGLRERRPEDGALANTLLELMAQSQLDYTRLFRRLGDFDSRAGGLNQGLRDQFIDRNGFDAWAQHYRDRLAAESSQDSERRRRMNRSNPCFILRNYLAQQAIEAAQGGDYGELETLLKVLERPYDEHPGMEAYAAAPPDWGRGLVLSCSS